MAVGIPIVPIVIRNAEIVASRNSTTINPGTVDVAVYPPIPVDDWTLDTLPERIAEVRQVYLDTLADWPVDELPEVGLYARAKKAAPKKGGRTRATRTSTKKAATKSATKTTAKRTQPRAPAKAKASPNTSKIDLKDAAAQRPTASSESSSSGSRGRP